MKHVLITFAVIFYLGFANLIHAQQKFAVIICGDHNASNIPAAEQWNQGMGCGQYGFDEFWNDSFLIWELLHDKMGYSNDNIHVLFANGIDYSSPVQHERYKSVTNHYNIPFIVDQPATKTNVTSLLATLASTVNEEDFLFVWIMSHGGNTNTLGSGDSYIYLSNYLTGENEKLFDYELRDMLNLIPALKKIIFLQAPYSGGFVNKAQNSNTIVMSSSQANESSFRADNIKPGNIPVIENEVLNGVIHHHGEFGYHIYSPLNGMDPSYNTMYGYEEFSSANSNNDDLVSIGEAVSWETGHHSTPCTPLVSDMGNHCPYSNLEYPTLIIEDIVTSKTYSGIVGITGPPSNPPFNSWTSVVIYACTVTFNKAEVVFLDDTRLYNHDGVINIGDNVNLRGNKGSSGLIAYEEINIGENVTFKGCIDSKWGGLAVQNVSVDLSNATFIDCHVIVNTIPELAIRGCTFLRSGLIGQFLYNNTFIGNDSYFINSFAHLFGNGSGNLIVTDSHFSGPVINYNTQYGLSLNHFKNYSIMNNTIQNFGYGVYLYYCSGPRDMRDINNNAILNNSYSGIFISHSYSKIFNNTGIHDNYRGIVCTNYSNVEITGNSEATHTSQTQRIHDNSVNQIWASLHSFPYLKWNAIWDNDNTSSLVYWDLGDSEPSAEDISNNFWGPQEYFDPQEDFSPYLSFNWQPVWNLQYGPPPANPDELLYESAETKMDQGDYQGAKADYLELITNFPQSKLSQAALKELLPLEKLTSNNFPELQSYYLNAPEVINNPDLFEIGYWLSNWCNVELNNFQAAIQFYENVLSAPPSFQDSIFAIIDLCYINYLMQNFNSKSGYSFDRPVFVQSSDEEYDKTVHLHSGLIFRNTIRNDSPEKNQTLFKPGELLQNTPNPFRSTTLLRYRLDETCNVQAKIFNSSGQLIKTLNDGLKTKGAHCIELMGNDLPEGLYLYSIELDGNITDTKKMLIIR